MAEREVPPADRGLRRCKTLKALRSKGKWGYECPEAESHNGNSGLYEEFAKAPEENYFLLLDFLGVARIAPPSYEIKNPHKEARSIKLSAWLHKPPASMGPMLRLIPQPYRHRLLWTLFILINTRYRERRPLDPEIRRQLQEYYIPDIQKLGQLIGRDLTGWIGEAARVTAKAMVKDAPVPLETASGWAAREELRSRPDVGSGERQ
jgi:hypothetical protein